MARAQTRMEHFLPKPEDYGRGRYSASDIAVGAEGPHTGLPCSLAVMRHTAVLRLIVVSCSDGPYAHPGTQGSLAGPHADCPR